VEAERDLALQIAVLAGKVDTVIARMEAGDRQSAQLVTLVKDQLTYQAADLGELKANVRELAEKSDRSTNAVRIDLETQLATLARDVKDLELWKARVGGIAAGSALLGSVVSAVVIKLLGS
jgi:hypothetical protein